MKYSSQKLVYILIISVLFFLSACDRIFVDGIKGVDADIQGKWQEKSSNTIYYNFQNNLFEYQEYIKTDSILSVYGYYTFKGDTAIYLELLPEYTYINERFVSYPLDFLGWDTIPGNSTTDTLTQQFSLKFVNSKELILSNSSKKYVFRKF